MHRLDKQAKNSCPRLQDRLNASWFFRSYWELRHGHHQDQDCMRVRAEIKIHKLLVASLEPTSPQTPTTFTRCIVILHLSILYFLCYHVSFQPLSFPLLFSAEYLTITVPKINHACKVPDLVQGFGFYALYQEELYPVYVSNSEVDSWNILLNSLEKPTELINCLYTAALHT